MKKISPDALAAALIITRIGSGFTAPYSELGCCTVDAFWAILASGLLTVILFLPVYFVCKKYGGEDLFSAAHERSKVLSRLLATLFAIALTAYLCKTLIDLQHFISDTVFPVMIFIVGASLTAAAALYGASKKAPALTRAAVFATALIFVLFTVVFAANFSEIDIMQLYPSFISDGDAFTKRLLFEVSANAEVLIFAVLCAETKKPTKALLPFFIITPVISLLLDIFYGTVLGNYLESSEYPFYIVSSLADISVFRRMDGFCAVVTLIACLIRLSLLICCFARCLGEFKKKPVGVLTLAAYIAFITAISWLFGTEISRKEAFASVINSTIPLVFAGMLLPLVSLIFGKKKKEEKKDA